VRAFEERGIKNTRDVFIHGIELKQACVHLFIWSNGHWQMRVSLRERDREHEDQLESSPWRQVASRGPGPVMLGWLDVGILGAWGPAAAAVKSGNASELGMEHQELENRIYGRGIAA
jgi:hypothetical protein